jgi:hypothetical protein
MKKMFLLAVSAIFLLILAPKPEAQATPANPTITTPASNASVPFGNVTVSGSNPGGGSIWIHLRNITHGENGSRVDMGSGAQFGHRVTNGGSTYSFTIPSGRLIASNKYRVAIECNRNGVSSWAQREFTVRAPANPTISSPASNVTVAFGNVVVSGNNPSGGSVWIHLRNVTTEQRVDLGSGANFGHRVSNGGSTYSFSIPSNRLVAGSRYRISIESNLNGVSTWAEREFIVRAPANPTITAPANNAELIIGNVVVSGNNPSGGSVWIHLRNATTGQRVDLGSEANSGHRVSNGGSTYSFTIPGDMLIAGYRYRISIESNLNGVSTWAEREISIASLFANDRNFVFYNQRNFSNTTNHAFGPGRTLSSSGCGLVSFAMAANALLPQAITPTDALAVFNNIYGANGVDYSWAGNSRSTWLTRMVEEYGLRRENVAASEDAINQVLRNGGIVLISGKGASPYTASGHYILIRGLTGDGRWKIADSGNTSNNTRVYNPNDIIRGNNGDAVALYRRSIFMSTDIVEFSEPPPTPEIITPPSTPTERIIRPSDVSLFGRAERSGFNGTPMIAMIDANSGFSFTITSDIDTDNATITFRYRSDNRQARLSVNGSQSTISFSNTNWQLRDISFPISLKSGSNTITLQGPLGNWAPDFTEITISINQNANVPATMPETQPTEIIVRATDMILNGVARLGIHGNITMVEWLNESSGASFTVHSDIDTSNAEITFLYRADGRQAILSINGIQSTISFPNTNWGWQNITLSNIRLREGVNMITLAGPIGNWAPDFAEAVVIIK